MKIHFLFFIATLIISSLMIVLGILFRKKWSPVCIVCLILSGILIVITSVLMCLCLGFFMV
jgi:hypothetical protein